MRKLLISFVAKNSRYRPQVFIANPFQIESFLNAITEAQTKLVDFISSFSCFNIHIQLQTGRLMMLNLNHASHFFWPPKRLDKFCEILANFNHEFHDTSLKNSLKRNFWFRKSKNTSVQCYNILFTLIKTNIIFNKISNSNWEPRTCDNSDVNNAELTGYGLVWHFVWQINTRQNDRWYDFLVVCPVS